MSLPRFKYHPDPLRTGAIEFDQTDCVCCGKMTEYVYMGPIYGEVDPCGAICPSCIAAGKAASKYNIQFSDPCELSKAGISKEIIDEVIHRTPGFNSCETDAWLSCCNEACEFICRADEKIIKEIYPEALMYLTRVAQMEKAEFIEYVDALTLDELGPTAYIFRCLNCGRYLAYTDET